jgi:hypothetical protein
LTPDAARTRTMVLVTHQLPDEASPRPTLTGSYQDIWRRTDAGCELFDVLRTSIARLT